MIVSVVVFAASVVTVLSGMIMTARYTVRRMERWVDTVVDNSRAVRALTVRVIALEKAIGR